MKKNVFDMAMEIEKKTEQQYLNMLEKTEDKGLRMILTLLAAEEARHHDQMKGSKEEHETEGDHNMMVEVTSILKKMKNDKATLKLNVSQPEMYEQARKLEKANYLFFKRQAEQADDVETKKILEGFAEEERQHCELLETLCDLVSRPEQWVEDAEFGNLDSY